MDADGTTLQLVQPLAPGPVADRFGAYGEGLDHICFLVDNVDDARSALGFVDQTIVSMGGRGAPVCFLPPRVAGVLIELTEPVDATLAR